MPIDAKACIVTGASRGIGRAIVQRLTRAGANVLAVARSPEDLAETARLAAGHAGTCRTCTADVTDSAGADEIVRTAVEHFGRLDVLVNNAGLAPLADITRITDTTLRELLALNIEAVVYTCRAAWPALEAAGGIIVNISSVAAKDPFPGFAIYGATKAWVNLFTQGLAAEGKNAGIRVYAVGPGAVETGMLRGAFPDFPANKCLQPDDVAGTVEWLLDDRCKYMTGQTLYVVR